MKRRFTFFVVCMLLLCTQSFAQRKMEQLGRGVVAVRSTSAKNLITWRLLGTEPQDMGFNIYRSANGAAPVKLNSQVLLAGTNFEDLSPSASAANTYIVKPVVAGVEKEAGAGSYTLPANTHTQPFYRVPIRSVTGYHVRYVWVGDLDGDGEYDYVIHKNPKPGSPSNVPDLVEAYKSDGTYLWTVDMGPNSHNRNNISPGSSALNAGHGDNMTVYDINKNGKSELILRTSNGVRFADGGVVSDANNSRQFISVVDGLTGREVSRTLIDNPYLSVGPMNGQMGIAYLDGINPSVVLMGANRNSDQSFNEIVNTWNWNGSTLVHNWQFDMAGKSLPSGHQIKIFDIDGDGKDEIIPQAFALDDDGTLMYNLKDQAIDHGDRFAISDLDPSRPGLEMYGIQQGYSSLGIMWYYSDAKTGKTLLSQSNPNNPDMGRGMTGDFDPRYAGQEFYTFVEGLYNVSGAVTSNGVFSSFPNLRMYWDGDLGSELLDNGKIVKWNYLTNSESRLYTPGSTTIGANITQNGRTTPAFYADIIGDWREEAVYESTDGNYLVVFTTPHFTEHRIYTLSHNPGYRNDMAVRGYFQSHNTDFYIGFDMQQPPLPPIQSTDNYWVGTTNVWDKSAANWSDGSTAKVFADGEVVMFDIRGANTEGITLNTTVAPGKVWVMNPESKNYAIAGSGKLTGDMDLWKTKTGSFTLGGDHDYTGATVVTEGLMQIDGSLQSKVTVKGLGAIGGNGTLAGGLVLEKGVSTDGGRISPGFGNTAETLGTLTIGGDLVADGSNFEFDVVPGSDKVNDQLVVTGNFTVSGLNRLILNFPDNEYAPGTYTLIRSEGTLSASLSNFKLEGITGVSKQLLIENNEVKVKINIARAPGTIAWTGAIDNIWNFDNENFALEGARTVFVSGDHLTFDGAAAQKSIDLTETVNPASVTFDSEADYTLSGTGSIGGTTDIVKNNTNNLSLLSTANTYTGRTIVNGGTLTVAKLGLQNEPSSIGAAGPQAENIQINNANFVINERSTTDRAITITGTSTITVPEAANYAIFNADIVGDGTLVKEGAGSISMVGAKSFTGPVVIKSGRVNLRRKDGNVGGLGTSNDITLENATLAMEDIRDYAQAAWNLTVPEGKNATLITDGRSTLLGKLKGAGTLNVFIPYVRTDFKGDWSEFTGRIVISNSDFRIANGFGYANAAIHLNTAWFYPIAGASTTIALGELSGLAGTALSAESNRTANWVIGAKNTDGTFAGNILKTSLTKVGTGTLTLTGNNRYTGATNVNEGRLLVSNAANKQGLGTGEVTVANGATLGGTGTIRGAITVQAGGRIQPGADGIGTLTDSLNITFESGAIAEMEVNRAAVTSDLLKAGGNLMFGGTLKIMETDTADFVIGDSFKLFEAKTYSGSFAAIEPATPGPGLIWNISELTTSGTIQVVLDMDGITNAYYWTGAAGSGEAPTSWNTASNWNMNPDGSGTNRTMPEGDDVLIFDGEVMGDAAHFAGPLPTETISMLQLTNGAKVTLLSNGKNIYTANTNIGSGRLLVNHAAGTHGIGAGAVTVAEGAVLGGTGFVKGAITVQSGGTLQPGADGIGTFTNGTSVTFASGAFVEMEIDKAAATFDVLKVNGNIAFDGKLVLAKVGTTDFANGDAYRLFDAKSYSGSFASIEPAAPGAGLAWDVSELETTGTIKVESAVKAITYYWRGLTGSSSAPTSWAVATNWNTAANGTGTARTTATSNDILVFDGAVIGTSERFVGNIPTETVRQIRVINGARVTFTTSVYNTTAITEVATASLYGGCTYSVTGQSGAFANLKPGDVLTSYPGAGTLPNPMPYAQVLAIQDDRNMTISKEVRTPASASQYFLAPTVYTDVLTVDANSSLTLGASNTFFALVINTKGGTVAGNFNFGSRGGHCKLICTTPNAGSNTAGLRFTNGASLQINTSNAARDNYNLGNTLGLYQNGNFVFNDGNGGNNLTPGYTGNAGIVFEAGSTFTLGVSSTAGFTTGHNYSPLGATYAATDALKFTPAVAFKPGSNYIHSFTASVNAPYFIGNHPDVSYPNLQFNSIMPATLHVASVENLTVAGTLTSSPNNTGSFIATGNISNNTGTNIDFGNVMMGGTANQTIGGTGSGAVAFKMLTVADKAEVTLARNISATDVHLLGKLQFGSNTITGTGTFATYAPYSKAAITGFSTGSAVVGGVNNTGAGTLQYEYPVGSSVTNASYLPARTLYRAFTAGSNGVLSKAATGAGSGQTATFSIEGAEFTTSKAGLEAATPGFSYLLDINGLTEQTITFAPLDPVSMGEADFNPGATASSDLEVAYTSSNTEVAVISNGRISLVGPGTTTITAFQSGNSSYKAAAPVSRELEVLQRTQTITFSMSEKMVGDADFSPATASSGLSVSYASSNTAVATVVDGKIRIVGAGTADITATQAGDDIYSAAQPVVQQLTVNRLYFVDADGDGFGSKESKAFATETTPSGYATNDLDCDDTQILYADNDGDGLGAGAPAACGVANNTDCDDTNPIQLTATVPDVYAINPAVDAKNTIYIGYGPTSLTIEAMPAGGTAPYSYKWNTGELTKSIVVGAAGTYTATVTDVKGCKTTASIIIKTQNVECGNNSDKVMVCHNGKSICISSNAVQEHLNHGDVLGDCSAAAVTATTQSSLSQQEAGIAEAKVLLYPNPVRDNLTITLAAGTDGAAVKLYNAAGAVVLSKNLTGSTSTISLKDLPNGMYYVQIKTGEKVVTEKIVKNNH